MEGNTTRKWLWQVEQDQLPKYQVYRGGKPIDPLTLRNDIQSAHAGDLDMNARYDVNGKQYSMQDLVKNFAYYAQNYVTKREGSHTPENELIPWDGLVAYDDKHPGTQIGGATLGMGPSMDLEQVLGNDGEALGTLLQYLQHADQHGTGQIQQMKNGYIRHVFWPKLDGYDKIGQIIDLIQKDFLSGTSLEVRVDLYAAWSSGAPVW